MKQSLKKSKRKAASGLRPTSPWFDRPFLQPMLIVLAALLCDLNSWGHEFLYDDIPYIVQNHLIQDPKNFFRIFGTTLVPPSASVGLLYRPMTALSYGLSSWISGLNASAFHLVNRLIHVLVCLMIFYIVKRLVTPPDRGRFIALVASLIFAVHPLQTEAVTYINGRSDSQAMLFFLLAWWFFLLFRSSETFAKAPYIFFLIFYSLGLLTKESVITLLGVIVLTELIYFSNRSFKAFFARVRHDWAFYAGYFTVSAIFLIVRQAVLRGLYVAPIPFWLNPTAAASLKVRWLTGLKVMWECLGQIVWPANFMPDYSFNQIPLVTSWISPASLLVVGFSLVLAVGWIWGFGRSPDLFFGLGYFFVTYSVVSNLFIPIGTIRGDRLLYMPLLGICFCSGAVMWWIWSHFDRILPRRLIVAAFTIILLGLGTRTVIRNGDWQNPDTLFLRHLDPLPSSSKLLNSIGNRLLQDGRTREAIVCFQKALEIGGFAPDDVRLNLGVAYKVAGEYDQALNQYDALLRENPNNAKALTNKGNLYLAQGNYRAAAEEYQKALRVDPHLTPAQTNLQVALERLGNLSSDSSEHPPVH